MITRERIVEEIGKIPDTNLNYLYQIIKNLERDRNEREESEESVLSKLRAIKISAQPDFSTQANLYDVEGRNA